MIKLTCISYTHREASNKIRNERSYNGFHRGKKKKKEGVIRDYYEHIGQSGRNGFILRIIQLSKIELWRKRKSEEKNH